MKQHRLKALRYNGDFRLSLHFGDGFVAELDFADWTRTLRGPVGEPLQSELSFAQAFIDHGVLCWPTGYDICPDVLRYWAEMGNVCSEEETNAHFAAR